MRRVLIPAAIFLTSGVLHFVKSDVYEKIVPRQLGDSHTLVVISGIAELAGGIGLLAPATRRAAGIGLVALLVAVWPANIFMAIDAERFAAIAPAWVWWARVPLQIPLILWVERVSRSRPDGGAKAPAPLPSET